MDVGSVAEMAADIVCPSSRPAIPQTQQAFASRAFRRGSRLRTDNEVLTPIHLGRRRTSCTMKLSCTIYTTQDFKRVYVPSLPASAKRR